MAQKCLGKERPAARIFAGDRQCIENAGDRQRGDPGNDRARCQQPRHGAGAEALQRIDNGERGTRGEGPERGAERDADGGLRAERQGACRLPGGGQHEQQQGRCHSGLSIVQRLAGAHERRGQQHRAEQPDAGCGGAARSFPQRDRLAREQAIWCVADEARQCDGHASGSGESEQHPIVDAERTARRDHGKNCFDFR